MADAKADELASRVAKAMLSREGTGPAWELVIEEARLGYARVRMLGRADMANGHGIIHGGMIFALADTAFAYACNGRNAVAVAASASIAYLSPAKIGETLVAEAVERVARGAKRGLRRGGAHRRRPRHRRIPGRVARNWRRDRRSARGERMTDAYICDAVRTPIGRYGGALAQIRPDDLAAIPMRALMERNPGGRLGRARRHHPRLRQSGGRG